MLMLLIRSVNPFILCNPFISNHNTLSSLLCNHRFYNTLLQTYSDELIQSTISESNLGVNGNECYII